MTGHGVGYEKYTQTARLEQCMYPGAPCSYISTAYHSSCMQKYSFVRLLAYTFHQGLHIDSFKLPIACSCHVSTPSPYGPTTTSPQQSMVHHPSPSPHPAMVHKPSSTPSPHTVKLHHHSPAPSPQPSLVHHPSPTSSLHLVMVHHPSPTPSLHPAMVHHLSLKPSPQPALYQYPSPPHPTHHQV